MSVFSLGRTQIVRIHSVITECAIQPVDHRVCHMACRSECAVWLVDQSMHIACRSQNVLYSLGEKIFWLLFLKEERKEEILKFTVKVQL